MRPYQVVNEHEVVAELLMHEVTHLRVKRKLEATEDELHSLVGEVRKLICNLTR